MRTLLLRNWFGNVRSLSSPQIICRHFSNETKNFYDLVVIGGGIVGVASAREILLRFPKLKVAVVEKESKLATHQTGHNSGVIHAGLYYKPGSLKAKLCVKGLKLIYDYLDKNNIPYKKCGKLVVATRKDELETLQNLYSRSLENGVPDVRLIDGKEISAIEPHCLGLKAVHSPHTGIVDWALVTNYFAKEFQQLGGEILLNFNVTKFSESSSPGYPVSITSKDGKQISTKYGLACAGLQSDIIARLSGGAKFPAIIPFRGEYLLLKHEFEHLVNGNIYPVPNPNLPFLGVHFTPRLDGSIWLGPNAVLAFKKEGYRWTDFDLNEFTSIVTNPGFIKLALKYPAFGLKEFYKSCNLNYQVQDLKQYIPNLERNWVEKGPSGVRAQALSVEGELIEDFFFETGNQYPGEFILHCRNAPSPGATSSMAIAEMITDKLNNLFHLSNLNN
ncbi:L-2-hydroxyglutarate dehydrogenase, mitochondrial [Chrysoperla carnea]|uniref:L-2-hydroxyglutarate dehydrogenase, mitochondrial n=1 Tax=Chrysoperla carnea TaxID=189513 RepID=UPI001D078F02|nr:L-2-hydroxyglutarate dehydrogenase, mitochondrial [Chrysoperla carnea]